MESEQRIACWLLWGQNSTRRTCQLPGVSRQRVQQLTESDPDFPEQARGRAWSRDAIEEWARAVGRPLADDLRADENGTGPAPNTMPPLMDEGDLGKTGRFEKG